MCWAKKCCFCVKVDVGCALLGVVSLLFSTSMTIGSAVLLNLTPPVDQVSETGHNPAPAHRHITQATMKIIEWTTLSVGVFMMIASVMLLVGTHKRKPSFLLCYFVFGIFFTIICKLSALLLLVNSLWEIALTSLVLSLIYIHCLVVVHTAYNNMQTGFSHFKLEEETSTQD